MIQIAIVEDNELDMQKLQHCLEKYASENKLNFSITGFSNGMEFITNYKAVYDIVFMDIEMPLIDGMSAARRLREVDQATLLIFITNLTQYAIMGYEVDAMDYILKPVRYSQFSLKMRKIIQRCLPKRDKKIRISTRSGDMLFPQDTILYIESQGHTITYFTENGPFVGYGTLKAVEPQLNPNRFFRCNSGTIINLAYVTRFSGSEVYLQDKVFTLSRTRKKEFMNSMGEYHLNER